MIELEEKNGIWQAMPQETPEQQIWADNYYEQELIPLAQQRFCSRYQGVSFPAYYGLFLVLGPAWERSAFLAKLLQPQNIHAICWRENMPQFRYLMKNLDWDEDRALCTPISRGDTESIYRVMKKQFDIWDSVGKCAVDFSGGSRKGTLAAAMAAGALHLPGYAIEAEYLAEHKRHMPGTERLVKVPAVSDVIPV